MFSKKSLEIIDVMVDGMSVPVTAPDFLETCKDLDLLRKEVKIALAECDEVCAYCDGKQWVEDKNWQGEFVDQKRTPGNGMIACVCHE